MIIQSKFNKKQIQCKILLNMLCNKDSSDIDNDLKYLKIGFEI